MKGWPLDRRMAETQAKTGRQIAKSWKLREALHFKNMQEKIRAEIFINGIVQGVGFRPFIHKLTKELSLCGWIRNTAQGVELQLEGDGQMVRRFIADLESEKPRLAVINSFKVNFMESTAGYKDFRILQSRSSYAYAANGGLNTLISPDICICEDCLREMRDPKDRRYGYPFSNCVNCGPRFSIIKALPYDRVRTSMAGFKMCPECGREYTDIEDRRYHAQPIACTICGPELIFIGSDGSETMQSGSDLKFNANRSAVAKCCEFLAAGKIAAIKGLGGIHLACLFDDEAAVSRLRQRKHRDEKALAIMCRDLKTAKEICMIDPEEERILTSARRPIVLLRKKISGSYQHISENEYMGIMLPYTPLHYLIMENFRALVMTSANISDTPIIYKNDDALQQLSGIADCFLLNNRDIVNRCDDSLVHVLNGQEYFIRRSRGYVPEPIALGTDFFQSSGRGPADADKMQILALGAEQKASAALLKGSHVFMCQHIGDLKNLETFEHYENCISHYEKIFDIKPQVLACDLHPDYMSTDHAEKRAKDEGLALIRVQHHHAHMVSCMADNQLKGACIAITWDGTGAGTDGSIWGGEFLVGDEKSFRRVGTILPFRLPGSDLAAKEIYRCAVSVLSLLDQPVQQSFISSDFKGKYKWTENYDRIMAVLNSNINCPVCSSMGRLFDAAAALLGIKDLVSYEGQGAVLLQAEAERYLRSLESVEESAAKAAAGESYDFDIIRFNPVNYKNEYILSDPLSRRSYLQEDKNDDCLIYAFDYRKMIEAMLNEAAPAGSAAVKFMNTLAQMAADMCSLISNDCALKRVLLSGGTFQNLYLLRQTELRLREAGLEVYHHQRISTNDEGLALGQAVIAAANIQNPQADPEN